jgi:hypothetical protein
MRVTLKIDLTDRANDQLRFDIQTWLQQFARDQWRTSEAEDIDGLKLLTFDFRNPLDAVDFPQWRGIGRHVCRS